MQWLMHIAFDNSFRLEKRIYYLEYRGVRFKLIQNSPRKWSDVLLTLVPYGNKPAQQQAHETAGEFLSALAWQNGSRITLRHAGGMRVPDNYTLRQAACKVFTFPEIPFGGHIRGFRLSVIPDIETDIQRLALSIYREGHSSNKVYLSFLFYWQVIELTSKDPVAWINKAYTDSKVHLRQELIRELPLGSKTLGEYLKEDCRHAIAHIRRDKPGRTSLRFDVLDENIRLTNSTMIVEEFAKLYIREELGLNRKLHLVNLRGRGFPKYVNRATLRRYHSVLAIC